MKSKQHYIFMADIVRSRNLKGKAALEPLKSLTGTINKQFREEILSPFTITLGDEFQGVVGSIESAVRMLIAFEELVLQEAPGFRLRYVIYYGTIETAINPESAHEMLGSGFTKAREQITTMKEEEMRFYINAENVVQSRLFVPALALYQHFTDDWAEKDYPLVSSFLVLKDYKKVAKAMKKDVSLMWRREKSLNIKEYREIKNLLILIANSEFHDSQ
jgi:hypothetical protein